MFIYIAGPLCSETERAFNKDLDTFLKRIGHDTYLPQLDGGFLDDLLADGRSEDEIRWHLFQRDLQAMDRCDTLLIIMDGRTIDEGACFELGYMYSRGKRCIGYKTDSRSYIRGRNNLMIDSAVERICSSFDELGAYLKDTTAPESS